MKHVAIVGCGQLARMLALAGWHMGIRFSFVACNNEGTYCVEGLGPITPWADGDNVENLYAALGEPDVVTVERESVSTDLLRDLAEHCPVYPNPDAVSVCQHRLREKALFDELNIATAPYRAANRLSEVKTGVAELGYPVVIKAASDGYDGKGQWRVGSDADLEQLPADESTFEWLIERRIPFDYEVSFIGVRTSTGDTAFYPPTKNVHRDGILIHSSAPADTLSESLQEMGQSYLRSLMESMNYVGVLAVECFVVGDQLLVNELAPRVHNSGHWTLQANVACQFENHLRAILGLSVGSTELSHYSGIVNILGSQPDSVQLEKLPAQASFHWYNKPFAPGRKLGHFGVNADSSEQLAQRLDLLQSVLD
ncbi:MAG: 5-(carboxyamino)imidazole ribonucleotide synthase [Halioglobus sp.]